MSLRTQLVITTALAAVLAAGWLWFPVWEGEAKPDQVPGARSAVTTVLVEPLELAEDRVVVNAIGTGESLQSASIYPTVSGVIVEVLFEAGQRVSKGEPLVRLDDDHERLAVRLAQVAEKEARRQAERLEQLAPSGNVSTARLETAQAEFESAIVRLDQARAALRDRTVFAPFDGVIGLNQVDVGDRVTDETLITTLDDRSALLVEFQVPEEYAERIKVGDPVRLRPWTATDREVHGDVWAIDSRIDPTTRTLRVKARIPNPDDTIRPGTSFEVRLTFTGRAYPSVREVAVLWSRDGAYLWRVAGDSAEKVFVSVVRRDHGRVLVDGPLEAGDPIVVEGVQGLRDGQPVKAEPYQSGDPETIGLSETRGFG